MVSSVIDCGIKGCQCNMGDIKCVLKELEHTPASGELQCSGFQSDLDMVRQQLLSGQLSRGERQQLWSALEFKWQYFLHVDAEDEDALQSNPSSGGGIASLSGGDDEEIYPESYFSGYEGGEFYWEFLGELAYDETDGASTLSVYEVFVAVLLRTAEEELLGEVERFDMCFGTGVFRGTLELFSSEIGVSNGERLRTVRRILDTGCSKTISGVPGRLKNSEPIELQVRGANGAAMVGYRVGYNSDDMTEVLVRGMAPGLVLLSAADSARKGVFIADSKSGSILEMSEEQASSLMKAMRSSFSEFMRVRVKNGVYEVCEEKPTAQSYVALDAEVLDSSEVCPEEWVCPEFAEYSVQLLEASSATTFFNSKLSFRSVDEKITAYQLMGWSLPQIRAMVRNKMVSGFDPEITMEVLARYEREHGSTPSVFQSSLKRLMGNVKADEGEPFIPLNCGHYVQVDTFYYDFNRRSDSRTEKMPTLGGATASTITIDCFSGFLMGDLISKGTKAADKVTRLFQRFENMGYKVEVLGADDSEVSKSDLRLFDTETLKIVYAHGARFIPAEPNNHSNGAQYVENSGMLVKNKMRQAFKVVFTNPNVVRLNWTVSIIVRLWGEIFFWALMVINLTESPNSPGKTRFEVFMGYKPDMQQIRMLPIFSILLAWDFTGDPETFSGQPHWEYGLYTGPYQDFPLMMAPHGVIRVAVRTTGGAHIMATSKYKDVSQGGTLNFHELAERGLRQLLDAEVIQKSSNHDEKEENRETPVMESSIPSLRTDDVRGIKAVIEPDAPVAERPVENEAERIGPIRPPVLEEVRPGRRVRVQRVDRELKDLKTKFLKKRAENIIKASGRPVTKTQVKKVSRALETKDAENDKQFWSKALYRTGAGDRELRAQVRNLRAQLAEIEDKDVKLEVLLSELERRPYEEGHLSWIDLKDGEYYYSLTDRTLYQFGDSAEGASFVEHLRESGLSFEEVLFTGDLEDDIDLSDIESYRVVTEGVPRNFPEALKDPVWGEPARVEENLLTDKVIVRVSADEARRMIDAGCDVVRLFPIYEIKQRDGKEVRKVRLVADGRSHNPDGPTYASTPSREEFLIYLHLIARSDWDFVHIDESRAFTGALHTDPKPVLVRMAGDSAYWKVINALYGLKTAPLMYQRKSIQRLESMGFHRKELCSNTFLKYYVQEDGTCNVVIIYAYVDDYFFTSNDSS